MAVGKTINTYTIKRITKLLMAFNNFASNIQPLWQIAANGFDKSAIRMNTAITGKPYLKANFHCSSSSNKVIASTESRGLMFLVFIINLL